jgi:hypothetical protein
MRALKCDGLWSGTEDAFKYLQNAEECMSLEACRTSAIVPHCANGAVNIQNGNKTCTSCSMHGIL